MKRRIVIVSDIHANAKALRAVLRHADARGRIDHFLIPGDWIGVGKFPLEITEWVMSLANRGHATVVRGNHEHAVVDPTTPKDLTEDEKLKIQEHGKILRPSDVHYQWIKRQPDYASYNGGSPYTSFALGHGNMDIHAPYAYPKIVSSREIETQLAHADTMRLDGRPRHVVLGHTHIPSISGIDDEFSSRSFRVATNKDAERGVHIGKNMRLVINAGSVGESRDPKDTRASYGVIVIDADGIHVQLYKVPWKEKSIHVAKSISAYDDADLFRLEEALRKAYRKRIRYREVPGGPKKREKVVSSFDLERMRPEYAPFRIHPTTKKLVQQSVVASPVETKYSLQDLLDGNGPKLDPSWIGKNPSLPKDPLIRFLWQYFVRTKQKGYAEKSGQDENGRIIANAGWRSFLTLLDGYKDLHNMFTEHHGKVWTRNPRLLTDMFTEDPNNDHEYNKTDSPLSVLGRESEYVKNHPAQIPDNMRRAMNARSLRMIIPHSLRDYLRTNGEGASADTVYDNMVSDNVAMHQSDIARAKFEAELAHIYHTKSPSDAEVFVREYTGQSAFPNKDSSNLDNATLYQNQSGPSSSWFDARKGLDPRGVTKQSVFRRPVYVFRPEAHREMVRHLRTGADVFGEGDDKTPVERGGELMGVYHLDPESGTPWVEVTHYLPKTEGVAHSDQQTEKFSNEQSQKKTALLRDPKYTFVGAIHSHPQGNVPLPSNGDFRSHMSRSNGDPWFLSGIYHTQSARIPDMQGNENFLSGNALKEFLMREASERNKWQENKPEEKPFEREHWRPEYDEDSITFWNGTKPVTKATDQAPWIKTPFGSDETGINRGIYNTFRTARVEGRDDQQFRSATQYLTGNNIVANGQHIIHFLGGPETIRRMHIGLNERDYQHFLTRPLQLNDKDSRHLYGTATSPIRISPQTTLLSNTGAPMSVNRILSSKESRMRIRSTPDGTISPPSTRQQGTTKEERQKLDWTHGFSNGGGPFLDEYVDKE